MQLCQRTAGRNRTYYFGALTPGITSLLHAARYTLQLLFIITQDLHEWIFFLCLQVKISHLSTALRG